MQLNEQIRIGHVNAAYTKQPDWLMILELEMEMQVSCTKAEITRTTCADA